MVQRPGVRPSCRTNCSISAISQPAHTSQRKEERGAYTLHNSPTLTSPRNCTLSIRMNQFSHSCRTHKQRQPTIHPQDRRPRVNIPHIPQHPRSKPNSVKIRLICVARKQIGSCAGIEGRRFGTGGLGRDDLEIMRVNQSMKGRLLVREE